MADKMGLIDSIRYSALVWWLATPLRRWKHRRDMKKPCAACGKVGTGKKDIGVPLCDDCCAELLERLNARDVARGGE